MHYLIGVLIFLSSNVLFSQSTKKCGTILSPEQIEWLRNYQAEPNNFSIQSRSTYYIPLKIHIVGDDDGDGYYALEYLMGTICTLNQNYAPLNMHFYIYGDIEYIDEDDYYDHPSLFDARDLYLDYTDTVFTGIGGTDTLGLLNLFFVGEPRNVCGYYTPQYDIVCIKNSCQLPGSTTLTHEIGHFFSLMHTFYGWEGGTPVNDKQEKVDGTNCSSIYNDSTSVFGSGDGFCDTGPDYLPSRWGTSSCSSGTLTDPNGATFTADATLYMSYSDDPCHTRFSTEQQAAILSNLSNLRPSFLDYPSPSNTSTPGTTTVISPFDGETNVPYNWVAFEWDAVPGASAYHLLVSNGSGFQTLKIEIDIMTSNMKYQNGKTTYYHIAELESGETYYWKVKALADGNTCGEYNFSAGPDCPSFTVGSYSNVTEAKGQNLKIYPNQVRSNKKTNITIRDCLGSEVSIINVTGKLISKVKLESSQLEIPSLHAGMYWLLIRKNETVTPVKLMVLD